MNTGLIDKNGRNIREFDSIRFTDFHTVTGTLLGLKMVIGMFRR